MSNLTVKVVETLTDEIRVGKLRPGDRVPTEVELMKRHQVSRSVIREAVSQLQASRLVEKRHGIGTFVIAPATGTTIEVQSHQLSDMLDVMAVLEFRIDLETASAGLAASRRSTEQLRHIVRAVDEFERKLDQGRPDLASHDVEFHLSIAKATGNHYFFDVLSQLGRSVTPRTRLRQAEIAELDRIDHLREVLSEHRSIASAIERNDADDARAAMRMHLCNGRERLKRAFDVQKD